MPKLIQAESKIGFSFKDASIKRFVNQFNRVKQDYNLHQVVLVLDEKSAKIISNLFVITSLVEYGIVFIEKLQVVRKRLDHHAIYFITPSQNSIELMLSDYKNPQQPQYRKAHILFTSQLRAQLMTKIKKNPYFLKKLAKNSFKQFYYQLMPISHNFVHMGINYLSLAFSKQNIEEQQKRSIICSKFIDIIACYESINTVRIYYESSVNKIAEQIAKGAAEELKIYLNRLLQNGSTLLNQKGSDITIYITDRSLDIVTPIIHGYAYDSLLYDILINSKSEEKEIDPTKLNGKLFDQFRYRHISHALTELPRKVDELALKIKQTQKISTLQINKLKQQKDMVQVHVEILKKLWQKFKQKKLAEVGQFELSLATGINEQGKQTSSSQLFDQIISIIKNNIQLQHQQLLRLALLTVICIQLSKQDYAMLTNIFKEKSFIFDNLIPFGIKLDKSITKSTKSPEIKILMEKAKKKLKAASLPSDRITTKLQVMLPRLLEFLQNQKSKTNKQFMQEIVVSPFHKEKDTAKFDDTKFVYFIAGGISRTQICSIRKNIQLSNILLASDCILTPNQFINAIEKIDIIGKKKK